MQFYLRWINPVVALAILVLCTWMYVGNYFFIVEDGQLEWATYRELEILIGIEDPWVLYFFAKGLFCSSMLFLHGEFLRRFFDREQDKI